MLRGYRLRDSPINEAEERPPMSQSPHALEPGDIVEIQYRLWRPADGSRGEDVVVERWISACVFSCEPGTWPLARLKDGQVTEIRPFMTWRAVSCIRRRASAVAA
jgi:hypothetical protein